MSWYALLVGFVFLTAALVTGWAMLGPAAALGTPELKLVARIVVGTVAWILYGVAILGRRVGRWPLSRLSGIAVGGFVIILVLIVVSAVVS